MFRTCVRSVPGKFTAPAGIISLLGEACTFAPRVGALLSPASHSPVRKSRTNDGPSGITEMFLLENSLSKKAIALVLSGGGSDIIESGDDRSEEGARMVFPTNSP